MRTLSAVLVLFTAACGPPPTLKRVETEVFAKSCTFAACHSASAPAEGLNLEAPTYAKLVDVKARGAGATDLTLVIAGKPDESYLYQKLSQDKPRTGARMPSNGDPLDAARLNLVRDWIAAGAENN
jgi:hypothetical protein